MTKEELEKLRSTVKEWLFHTGSLNPNNYADELCKDFIEPREKRIAELEAQIEKMKKYGKLLLDICDVMGNDPYMVWRGLEQRVLILWDKSEEEKGLKMADDILERLLKISVIDWAEIEKWEIKEK